MSCIVYYERNRSKLLFKNIDTRNSEVLKLIHVNIFEVMKIKFINK